MKQREILLGGKIVRTSEPSDYVIAYRESENIWKFLCSNDINTLDVRNLRPFCIERYTKLQAQGILNTVSKFGDEKHKRFRKFLFNSFVSETNSKHYVTFFDDIKGKKIWLDGEVIRYRNKKVEKIMKAIFKSKLRMKNRGKFFICCNENRKNKGL